MTGRATVGPVVDVEACGEYMPAMSEAGAVVDILFDIAGSRVPVDYATPLACAVADALPWFESEPRAGIHPLRAAVSTHGMLVLARRAKLVLRIPSSRVPASLALAGRTLDVAGEAVAVHTGSVRPLLPSATLYAQRVATGAADASAFHAEIADRLLALEVRCEFISGRARPLSAGGRDIAGYGLALHGLSPSGSLRVQREGIGADRRLGCGIFVPHKAIATAA